MPALMAIWTLLRPYWKYLAVCAIIATVLGAAYLKGRHDASISAEKAVVKELNRRVEAVGRERAATEHRRSDIRSYRGSHPQSDAVDSCLLSNDPFAVDCLKSKK